MSSLTQLLRLTSSPVAIAFVDTAPAGVAHVSDAEPAGCGYWRRAAAGEVFYTIADDHKSCPVGAHTHNVPLSSEEKKELTGLVDTMLGLQYLKMEEMSQIPIRKTPLRVAVYAPLNARVMSPDVVLVRGNARQLMLLRRRRRQPESLALVRQWGGPLAPWYLRRSMPSTATSFGCIGNRVYTATPDDEAYFAIPGAQLRAVEEKLMVIVHANEALEKFHRARAASTPKV
jgi:uncharacterized protein (DUF169 family)